jgi:hypothetical protein
MWLKPPEFHDAGSGVSESGIFEFRISEGFALHASRMRNIKRKSEIALTKSFLPELLEISSRGHISDFKAPRRSNVRLFYSSLEDPHNTVKIVARQKGAWPSRPCENWHSCFQRTLGNQGVNHRTQACGLKKPTVLKCSLGVPPASVNASMTSETLALQKIAITHFFSRDLCIAPIFQRNQRPGKEATRPESRDGHQMN